MALAELRRAEEAQQEAGLRRGADAVLSINGGDRGKAIEMLRRWQEEAGDQRWGLVADLIERETPAVAGPEGLSSQT